MMNPDPGLTQALDKIIEKYGQVHDELEHIWAEKMVFTWHWWLDVALAVLPWVVWLIVRDRKKQHSLLYGALFTVIVAMLLDTAGVSQGGWNYNSLLLPFFPQYLPWDLTIFPVTAMLYYQFFPKLSPWLKGAAFAVTASYIVEPVFVLLGIYEQSGWEHHYSLPIYFVIFMLGYWLYSGSLHAAKNAAAQEKHHGI